MGRLAIVEEDDVSTGASSVIVPPNKKSRTNNDSCGNNFKTNTHSKSYQYVNEAQGKSLKKHQSYKKTSQRQRIQNQTSRKTKGISDESGYFEEEVDDEATETQVTNPAANYFSCPLVRENSPTISSLVTSHHQLTGLIAENNGPIHSIETVSKDSRESIEIIYDRNAEIYEKHNHGVVIPNLQTSHKYLSKSNVFHPKASSLLKTELLKDQLEYSENLNKISENMGRSQHTMELITNTMAPSTNPISSSSSAKPTVTTASSSSMLPTTTQNTQIQSSGVITTSSNNHVTNSAANEVTTNSAIPPAPEPSPTKSLQVTMKDFDLLKVLGTGGK